MGITFDSGLAHRIGLNAAIIYGALIEIGEMREAESGYMRCTVEMLADATTLSVVVQLKAIKRLIEYGMVEVTYAGLPRKRHIHILDVNQWRLPTN